MYNKSESITNLCKAMIEFKKTVGKVLKRADNPFFKSKYAELPDIQDAIEEPLNAAGISYMQFPVNENELITLIMHTSGEFIESSYIMKPVKNDPQGLGSCITYQKRYALVAALGLNVDKDDDGNAASGNGKPQRQQAKPEPQPQKQVSKRPYTDSMLIDDKIMKWICDNQVQHTQQGRQFDFSAFVGKYIEANALQMKALHDAFDDWNLRNI